VSGAAAHGGMAVPERRSVWRPRDMSHVLAAWASFASSPSGRGSASPSTPGIAPSAARSGANNSEPNTSSGLLLLLALCWCGTLDGGAHASLLVDL
jgi:hypothetical protein